MRLRRQLKALEDRYLPVLESAPNVSDEEEVIRLWDHEAGDADRDLVMLESKILRRRAVRWKVQIPNDVLVKAEDGSLFVRSDDQRRIGRLVDDVRKSGVTALADQDRGRPRSEDDDPRGAVTLPVRRQQSQRQSRRAAALT